MQDVHDLALMLERHTPILVIETHEEPRALDLLTRLAIKRGAALQQWTLTDGLRRLGFGEEPGLEQSEVPERALLHIKQQQQGGIFVFCDLHPFIAEPQIVRLLKDIALQHVHAGKTLVLLSHRLEVPDELMRLSARFQLQLPNEQQLMTLVQEEARRYAAQSGTRVKTDEPTLKRLVANLRGLTYSDARRLIRGAIVDDGAITAEDVPEVSRAKLQLMDMDGVMGFEYDTARFGDVAGLDTMKQWLQQRQQAFLEADTDMRPKGMLLFGVQGSGKSLAAKAVAGSWGVPLLRLDMGALYNKFFGETERNLREALQLAELMAPCVVWIDEIEKALAGDSQDNGVSQRLLGTLLTWLAERKQPVFVVATANNIHALPPELMRKGRLDEIFFVDLPDASVREAIFRIHLGKRGHDVDAVDLGLLAAMTEGFSGAEIEQVVVAAWYASAEAGKTTLNDQPLTTQQLVAAANATQPLSVTMAEPLQRLRLWAAGRAVSAN
ncbi:AAA family ATPase [Candidatus Thalassolituus haligoni]|uniref:AAA family ATPase n=1 Tax=Candidatus Thalassolituus haligoni TaxID=3100113 RepID=UPI0035174C4B|tara:strand:+ start:4242 stop:5729 length:1488 start_codon:yes stop_codon:yes gene_type:complete